MLAHITVAAIAVTLFSEIVEQYSATAHTAFGILLHTLQLQVVHVVLATAVGKLSELDDVGK